MFKQIVVAFCVTVGALSTLNFGTSKFRDFLLAREAMMRPVWSELVTSHPFRSGHRICWTLSGEKFRALASYNVDTFVDISNDTLIATSTDPKGNYRTLNTAPGVGKYDRIRCVRLPDSVTSAIPLTVREEFFFHGTWGDLSYKSSVTWPPPGVENDRAPGPRDEIHPSPEEWVE